MTFRILFYLLVSSIVLSSCGSQSSMKNTGQRPGYYQQWLYMKTNGENVLPDMSNYQWDIASSKRSNSNALLKVSEFGPGNIGGRIRAIVVDYSTPNRLLIGGASGGVFESLNNGASWRAINDQALSPSVTYMSQNPFNPNLIYYCTGEASGNSADLMGYGIFKSVDGGKSFAQLPFTNRTEFQFNWSVKCSPKDSNTLYVATDAAGLWRSTNGGDTFIRVYNTGTEMNDLEVFPDGSVMFTLKGSGVYRSDNGNINTFSKVATVNSTSSARGELAYCKNFPKVVYAAISGPDNSYNGVLKTFYKSSDGGKTFVAKTNPTGTVNFGFTWYTLTMEINPNDTNGIYIASVDAGYSTNGGASWTGANYQHSDHHMAITGNGFLYVGHDGGLSTYKWNDFSQFNNLNSGLNITQFYHGDVSPHNNYVFGGTQDNGTKESRNFNPTFTNIFGGDGGYSFYHATKSTTRYYATQNGAMYRNGNNIANNLPVQTDAKWFIHPFTVSETIGEYILYPAGANIYFSSNEGNSFKKIGNTTTGRLFSAALSEDANPAAFTGGSNSLAAVDSVMNATPKYKDLRSLMPSYIRASFVGSIKVVPGFRDKIYIAFNNIADSGRIWKVSNIFGTPVFTNISRGLPKGLPVNWVECDPFSPEEVIFAGTDYGLYVTEDGGLTWTKDTRVPSTVVSCIAIAANKKDIYFFTHGRGVFKGLINNAGISSIDKTSIDILKTAYPVPASDVLNVELSITGNATYQMLDAQGKLVKTGELSTGVNAINVQNLNSGNYILIYTSPEGEGLIRFDILH